MAYKGFAFYRVLETDFPMPSHDNPQPLRARSSVLVLSFSLSLLSFSSSPGETIWVVAKMMFLFLGVP